MITEHIGNIFDNVLAIAEQNKDKNFVIVHGCNAQGRMGTGIALEVKERFPEVYAVYKAVFDSNGLIVGDVIPVAIRHNVIIANAITQKNYGYDGARYLSYDGLNSSLIELHLRMDEVFGEYSLSFPLIGAGLAGGDWGVISSIIEATIPDNIEKHLYKLK